MTSWQLLPLTPKSLNCLGDPGGLFMLVALVAHSVPQANSENVFLELGPFRRCTLLSLLESVQAQWSITEQWTFVQEKISSGREWSDALRRACVSTAPYFLKPKGVNTFYCCPRRTGNLRGGGCDDRVRGQGENSHTMFRCQEYPPCLRLLLTL